MGDVCQEIESVILRDPGNRGIKHLGKQGDLAGAAETLLSARHVLIVTGFYVPSAKACETDGPPGAWAIAESLARLGIQFSYVTDRWCAPILERAGYAPLVVGLDEARRVEADALLAIERPGRSRDGSYRNMRGINITPHTDPLDALFVDQTRPSIGIGDGGNEIGMGKIIDRVSVGVSRGEQIGSVVATDHLVVAGTSNWGAWGLSAALSCRAGQCLLALSDRMHALLEHLVVCGAVDGLTGLAVPTVDGLEWPVHEAVLEDLHAIVAQVVPSGDGQPA